VKDLLLLAASGLAREAAAADQDEYRIVGILDDATDMHGRHLSDLPILGGIDVAVERGAMLLVCVGSGRGRRQIVQRLHAIGVGDARFATLVDQSVRIPATCSIGVGSILLAGSVLTADVTIGRHVVVMPHVTLTHDDVIADFATLAAGVSLGGMVAVGEAAYIGMNASVRERTVIGDESTVGMGAVVLGNVPANETWVGVPARSTIPDGPRLLGVGR
jgi:sugar O-acyltransferase (sialic acid O-acetyltransferase NeuD family)